MLFTVVLAIFGIVILGIFLGIFGSFIIERHEEAREMRLRGARAKIMNEFSLEVDEQGSKPKTLFEEIYGIVLSELPILLVLVVFAAPIVYVEGWDVVTG